MSKGLGELQREIMNTLQTAKESSIFYRGNARQEWYGEPKPIDWKFDKPGWVISRGRRFRLADHVFDLRASLAYLAMKHKAFVYGRYIAPSFDASFSRATKNLVARGLLEALTVIPIVDYMGELDLSSLMELSDGLYFVGAVRQRRFVRAV